ncbi:hypothetical protein ABH922_002894 [Rhodococcus sp. 27YEA15]|uniref:hypothetical protein n=1 Tax=Rhodococcus sp. 27YEA15 TaxID=3156259 RepID=UPI003C7D2E9F
MSNFVQTPGSIRSRRPRKFDRGKPTTTPGIVHSAKPESFRRDNIATQANTTALGPEPQDARDRPSLISRGLAVAGGGGQ